MRTVSVAHSSLPHLPNKLKQPMRKRKETLWVRGCPVVLHRRRSVQFACNGEVKRVLSSCAVKLIGLLDTSSRNSCEIATQRALFARHHPRDINAAQRCTCSPRRLVFSLVRFDLRLRNLTHISRPQIRLRASKIQPAQPEMYARTVRPSARDR